MRIRTWFSTLTPVPFPTTQRFPHQLQYRRNDFRTNNGVKKTCNQRIAYVLDYGTLNADKLNFVFDQMSDSF